MSCRSFDVFGLPLVCSSWRADLGFWDLSFVLGGGKSSVVAWYSTAIDIGQVLSGAVDHRVRLFCC